MEYQSILYKLKQKQCLFEEINHPPRVSSPLRCAWSPPYHRFLTVRQDCPCRMLILRNVAVAIRQTLNILHDRIDTKVRQTDLNQQASHLLVIFENLEATLKTETTFSNLSCS